MSESHSGQFFEPPDFFYYETSAVLGINDLEDRGFSNYELSRLSIEDVEKIPDTLESSE